MLFKDIVKENSIPIEIVEFWKMNFLYELENIELARKMYRTYYSTGKGKSFDNYHIYGIYDNKRPYWDNMIKLFIYYIPSHIIKYYFNNDWYSEKEMLRIIKLKIFT